MKNQKYVSMFGVDENDMHIVKTLANDRIYGNYNVCSCKNDIPSHIKGSFLRFDPNERLIAIINTGTDDWETINDLKSTFNYLIRYPEILVCYFVPDVATELGFPEEFKNQDKMSWQFAKWLIENRNELKKNENIQKITEFLKDE